MYVSAVDSNGEAVVVAECTEIKGGGHRASRMRELSGFVNYSLDNFGACGFWTFGTPWTEAEGFVLLKDCLPRLGRYLTERGLRYIFVLESGSKGGCWHCHALIDGYLSHSDARFTWGNITGVIGVHVDVQTVSELGKVSDYLTKGLSRYLTKDSSKVKGRKFIASKGLLELIDDYMPARAERRVWVEVLY